MTLKIGKNSAVQTDFLLTDTAVIATPVDNAFGGAVTIHTIVLNCAGAVAYYKFYDTAAADVGTDDPVIILQADAGEITVWNIIDGIALTNLSYAQTNSLGTGGDVAATGTKQLFLHVR